LSIPAIRVALTAVLAPARVAAEDAEADGAVVETRLKFDATFVVVAVAVMARLRTATFGTAVVILAFETVEAAVNTTEVLAALTSVWLNVPEVVGGGVGAGVDGAVAGGVEAG
jgi:hypothetical protein